MHSPNWSDDDELLLDLTAALRPVPRDSQVIEAAGASHLWLGTDLELELAELLHDSYADAHSSVRSQSNDPRILVFGSGPVRVEIELSDGGIEGQLIPPRPGLVRLFTATGCVAETNADDVGCFWFPTRHKGPIRLACVVGESQLMTCWVNT